MGGSKNPFLIMKSSGPRILPTKESDKKTMNNLDVKDYPTPPVSIIIPAFNQLSYCRLCVQSIFKNTDIPYNLHLIDNGSSDGVGQYFDTLKAPNVFVYHTGKNLGFSGGNNVALKNIRSGHVLLLNSDTIVPPNWLSRMLNILEVDETIGMLAPMSNYAPGVQQIENLNFNNDDEMYSFAEKLFSDYGNQHYDVPRVIGFCCLIRDKAFQQIGLLDERFGIGTFEDDDYNKRIISAGYRLCLSKGCFVFHYGSKTFTGMGIVGSTYKQLIQKNSKLFREKWEKELPNNTPAKIENISIPPEGILKSENIKKVSVIIPCYNYGSFLRECVQSVLDQTYPEIEIVVVDDHSNIATEKIVSSLSKISSKIRVFFNKKNMGRSYSRNFAIKQTNGFYILPLDADDKLHPRCVEMMVSQLEKLQSPWDIAYCGVKEFGSSTKNWFNKYDVSGLLRGNLLACTSMYKRQHWEEIGGYNENVPGYEDWEFWVNMAKHEHYAYPVPYYLFQYRKHKASQNLVDRSKGNIINRFVKNQHCDFFDFVLNSGKFVMPVAPNCPSYDVKDLT